MRSSLLRLLVIFSLPLLLAAGCRQTLPNVCPASRGLRCMTRKICEMDQTRGCQVCQCDSAKQPRPASHQDGPPRPVGGLPR